MPSGLLNFTIVVILAKSLSIWEIPALFHLMVCFYKLSHSDKNLAFPCLTYMSCLKREITKNSTQKQKHDSKVVVGSRICDGFLSENSVSFPPHLRPDEETEIKVICIIIHILLHVTLSDSKHLTPRIMKVPKILYSL